MKYAKFCPPRLVGNDIHLWRIDLSGAPWPGLSELLDDKERRQAARFKFVRDRNRYLIAHHVLRLLVAGYVGSPPERLQIILGQHDKPRLVSNQFGFNLSHSGVHGLLAIGRMTDIGVDVEAMRGSSGLRKLAASIFSAAELDELASTPDCQLAESFYHCWTRKEACLKATGAGLNVEPNLVNVGLGTARSRVPLPGSRHSEFIDVVSVAGIEACAAAVAAVGGFGNAVMFEYDYGSHYS